MRPPQADGNEIRSPAVEAESERDVCIDGAVALAVEELGDVSTGTSIVDGDEHRGRRRPSWTETTIVDEDDVVGAIVERSADHDLTVLGATREGVVRQFVFGSIPESVGERSESTVVIAKKEIGLSSRVQTLFGRRDT